MSASYCAEPLAVRIADGMLRKDSGSAFAKAEALRDIATGRNNIARSDLFVAVCAIICWREQVVSRMKLPTGDRS